ncbi:Uncharacterised protein [Kingella potus]|uniref:Uncharacterized protein n=1 Tax=Kingella potus TaxID=265175 RepID=A0A377QZS1_9NEIS|nr:hypothetical protein [Kingella potus]UOP01340.1 hypothetical protein LVJ84_03585 [Kingella potus]STR00349.1 Uncharacterised protein [Kingella potus]
MPSHLIPALMCLTGVLFMLANFSILPAVWRGKNRSFAPFFGALLWCAGIRDIQRQHDISNYWYAAALLDIGVWLLPLMIWVHLNHAWQHSAFRRVAQFERNDGGGYYRLSFYRNGDAVLSYRQARENRSRTWHWERTDTQWRIGSLYHQITAEQQDRHLVFAGHTAGQQDGMLEHLVGQTFVQK